MQLGPFRLLFLGVMAMASILAGPGESLAQDLGRLDPSILQNMTAEERAAILRALGQEDRAGEQPRADMPPTVLPPDGSAAGEEPDVEEEPRLEPGMTAIITMSLPDVSDSPEGQREQEQLLETFPQLDRILGAAVYRVDREGMVAFPGIAEVYVAGLTAEEAARRIMAEPRLRELEASVVLLPLSPRGVASLEPFGYRLFEGVPTTFAPATDVPVPFDYVIGPGDEVRIQLYGSENAEYNAVVSRDGTLDFPGIGPVVVAGLRFDELKEMVRERVGRERIGVQASVTLGQLRSIRVFVLGDVNRPGSFTVSGLSTMTNALFASGGVNPSGSLRNVQLKRSGRLVQQLDLYDLLLRGDNSGDARLMPGDVIFVPPLGPTVAVGGEVRRPGIYELRGPADLGSVVALAGGALPTAFTPEVRVERIGPRQERVMLTLDLDADARTVMRGGDSVFIDPLPSEVENAVRLSGHVERPGLFGWRENLRLSDLLSRVGMLRSGADTGYVLIRRQPTVTSLVSVISVDLAAVLSDPGGPDDPRLAARDEIFVFDLAAGRRAVVDPLLEELRLQAIHGRPAREVTVSGMVRAPGTYPLEEGMRISDLLRAGANLTDSAYSLSAEISRYQVDSQGLRQTDLIPVDLQAVLAGDPAADLVLQPFDFLNIKETPNWKQQGVVEIKGEVSFPGVYRIEQGETLRSLLDRAGGLTGFAFPAGAVFLREELREREREQIKRLASRLESDLVSLSLQAARSGVTSAASRPDQSLAVGQALLQQLKEAQPMGRLVIDLGAVAAGDLGRDVILRDGDVLYVPQQTQSVTVLGEVQYSTSHLHEPAHTRDHYLALSGGLTANADEDRIYVVRANGAVIAQGGGSKWFRNSSGNAIQPGDTIVVPLDIDRVPTLAVWQASTSILYNLAISVAAVGSL